ncbi:Sir2 family NAD+-dependent deacetylase [Alteromonas halophila]|uniref:NAD-dependent protein deacylase n=1 Tax=Alteromonas halophila TaxID=516698 RepID=A0A918JPS2_9ALTE|nr:Sir2 family NAD+-dependent deacetylase [Alteromonas halophila]GGW88732.1 NAD-dependent protein deacylase [Alteromonas halophila]
MSASLPNVVILTGAGISAESGLKTFRDNDGLWENHRLEDVATPEAFARDPDTVYRFYNTRREQLMSPDVSANDAHLALAELERALGDRLLLVTQNVDNLHERSGSKRILHMHGTLLSARCMHTGQQFDWSASFDAATPCPCCSVTASLRPDIVWFGEVPMHMDDIIMALSKVDYFIAIGTSGQVYPAAGFVEVARDAGATTVELNLQGTGRADVFDESYEGPASEVVPAFVSDFLENLKN